jgi:ADP-ribose pyrophosphatase
MRKVIPEDAVLIPDNADRVFLGIIYDTYHWQQELFDGSETTFEMLKRPDTLVTIGVDDDQVVFIEEEQPHAGKRLNFAGGRIDSEDTSLVEAAQREMREETGYEFNRWRLVDVIQPYLKIEWFIHIFLASDVKSTAEPAKDAGERIVVRRESFDTTRRLCLDGVGYLGHEARKLFERTQNLDELLSLPEFSGQEVDR